MESLHPLELLNAVLGNLSQPITLLDREYGQILTKAASHTEVQA